MHHYLDEGTAAAEAMILAYGASQSKKKDFIVDDKIFPQTLAGIRNKSKTIRN